MIAIFGFQLDDEIASTIKAVDLSITMTLTRLESSPRVGSS